MKENQTSVAKALVGGLRSDWRARRNDASLSALVGLQPSEHGLVRPDFVYNPFTNANLLTNSDFASDLSSWTVSAGGWTWDAGTAKCTQATNGHTIEQDIPTRKQFYGFWYRVYFDVTLNNAQVKLYVGGALRATVSTSGHYGYFVSWEYASGTVQFVYEATGGSPSAVLDNVEVRLDGYAANKLQEAWNFSDPLDPPWSGTNWSYVTSKNGFSGVAKATGSLGTQTLTFPYEYAGIRSGKVYRVTYTVVDIVTSTGSQVKVGIGNVSGSWRTKPGTYMESITAIAGADPDFHITAQLNFANDEIYIANVVVEEVTTLQVFRGRSLWLLADSTDFWLVDLSHNQSVVQKYKIYSYNARTTRLPLQVDPSISQQWHITDLGNKFFVAVNAASLVANYKPDLQDLTPLTALAVTGIVSQFYARTVAEHRGRLLFGGMKYSIAENTDLAAMWNIWSNFSDWGMSESDDLDGFVYWGAVGGGMLDWYFDEDSAITGYIQDSQHGSDRPLILEYWRRNDMGFTPVPTRGAVVRLLSLGKAVVVYCDEGVSVMTPFIEPEPTFGIDELMPYVGIVHPSAVDGDKQNHVMVDFEGVVWRIAQQVNRLGFEEFLDAALESDLTVVWYDNKRGEWYLTVDGESGSYILGESGMGRSEQSVQGFFQHNGARYGITDGDGTEAVSLTIENVDFGQRGIKMLRAVEVSAYDIDSLQVEVVARFNSKSAYPSGTPITCTPEGVATTMRSGIEFKITITGVAASDDARIDDVRLMWQYSDFRTLRGLTASESDAYSQGRGT